MKYKKLLLPILLLGLILTGCSNQKKEADPVLNKNQVLKLSQKPFTSGQVIQSFTLKTDTSAQTYVANTIFGGENGTIFHIKTQGQAQKKTRSSEEWVNMNNVFINGGSAWYKANLEQISGHNYANLVASIMNNQIITDPSNALVKSYKLSRDGQTYTLTATTNDPDSMKTIAENVANTVGETKNQKELFQRILKNGKYQKATVKMVIKDKKLYSCNIFVNMKLGSHMFAKIGQSYGNFGSHNFLKIPASVLDAKPLASTNSSSNKK